jgi:lysophospholipase L1-like esterase
MKWRRSSRIALALSATVVAITATELGFRLFPPDVRLSYADDRFSARYHHASPEFLSFLDRVAQDPAAFKGDVTVAILGDSFVAGDGVEPSKRFTTLMQRDYDAAPGPRVTIVSFGFTSYTTLLYDRLYQDVVLKLDPDVVIICLDQTDVADDYLYEQERSSDAGDFEDTVLENYQSYPLRFFLLRHSQLFLRTSAIVQQLTGESVIPASVRAARRDAIKLRLYFETCKDPESRGDLFPISEKYIRSIARRKPPRQKLYFVTYPRAENLAGQRKTTLLLGALPDRHASTPYFEHWIRRSNLAAALPDVTFVHTTEAFRRAIASTDRQYYLHVNDVHWNADGHRLFADVLEREILPVAGHDVAGPTSMVTPCVSSALGQTC